MGTPSRGSPTPGMWFSHLKLSPTLKPQRHCALPWERTAQVGPWPHLPVLTSLYPLRIVLDSQPRDPSLVRWSTG